MNVGFDQVVFRDRRPFGLSALARYPIFPPEFLDFVKSAVPAERQNALVYAVDITATAAH